MKFASIITLICAAGLLSACAMEDRNFPSLGKRAIEEEAPVPDANAAPPELVTALPADLQASVDRLVRQSNGGHSAFLKALPAAKSRTYAARGSAVSSEVWVVAQMELAALEMTRGPSIDALAEIEDIYIARLDAEFEEAPAGGAALIGVERADILEQVTFQQAAMDELKSQLR